MDHTFIGSLPTPLPIIFVELCYLNPTVGKFRVLGLRTPPLTWGGGGREGGKVRQTQAKTQAPLPPPPPSRIPGSSSTAPHLHPSGLICAATHMRGQKQSNGAGSHGLCVNAATTSSRANPHVQHPHLLLGRRPEPEALKHGKHFGHSNPKDKGPVTIIWLSRGSYPRFVYELHHSSLGLLAPSAHATPKGFGFRVEGLLSKIWASGPGDLM